MTLRFSCIPLLVLMLCAAPSVLIANVVDRSVAIVNQDTITLSEVNEMGQPLFKKVVEETPANQQAAAMQEARRVVIDKLIDKKLLLQEAKKLNIQVSDQDVEGAVQHVLASNKSTMEQLRKELAGSGMTEQQYREELREQILTSRLITHEVRTKVVISDDAVNSYYRAHYTSQTGGGGMQLQQIGCAWGKADASGAILSREEAKGRASKAHDLAVDGKDFTGLVKTYSNLPSAAYNGDLGTFQASEMAEYIRSAVAGLKTGQISSVVEADNSFQFFKVVAAQEGETVSSQPLDDVKEQIREKLGQQAMEQRFKEWFQSIRSKAYIRIL